MANSGDGLYLRNKRTWYLDCRINRKRYVFRLGKDISRPIAKKLAIAKREEIALKEVGIEDENGLRMENEAHGSTPLHIYFIQAKEYGPVKIGKTQNVAKRLAALQTGSPEPLTLLAVIPNVNIFFESQLHRYFARFHLRGEWYRWNDELSHLIEKCRKVER